MGNNSIKKIKYFTLADFIIIDLLRKRASSTIEIQKELSNFGISVSTRTITRYLVKIKEIFNIKIKSTYTNREPFYNIEDSEIRDDFFEMGKSTYIYYNLFNAILRNKKTANHIIIDSIKSKGVEYAEIILQAIEHYRILEIKIKEIGEDKTKIVFVKPYLLKSYLNRWYIIGSKGTSNKVERFALYKIEGVYITTNSFTMPRIDDIKEKYNQIVGVTHYDDNPPKPPKVVIKFIDYQFKYFETEPWVKEYEIEKRSENDKTVIVSFYVHPNNELHQRILFNNVKCRVLEPKSLVTRIKDILSETLELYKN